MTACNCDVRLCECPPIVGEMRTKQDLAKSMQEFGQVMMDAFKPMVEETSRSLAELGKVMAKARRKPIIKTHFGAPAYTHAIFKDGTVISVAAPAKPLTNALVTESINARDHIRALIPPPLPSTPIVPSARRRETLEDAVCCTFHAGGVVLQPNPPTAVTSQPHALQTYARLNRH